MLYTTETIIVINTNHGFRHLNTTKTIMKQKLHKLKNRTEFSWIESVVKQIILVLWKTMKCPPNTIGSFSKYTSWDLWFENYRKKIIEGKLVNLRLKYKTEGTLDLCSGTKDMSVRTRVKSKLTLLVTTSFWISGEKKHSTTKRAVKLA